MFSRYELTGDRILPVGTVFVATSPVVANHNTQNDPSDARYTRLSDGQLIFSKPMWWVVVETFDRHYICVPITTYNGQGTTKCGIRPEHHGVAYDSRRGPSLLHGEASLQTYSVLVDPGQRRQIDPASRIDFSKPNNFENYRLVSRIVGMIDPNDLPAFEGHYRRVRTGAATHEYENINTAPLSLSASNNRVVAGSCFIDKDILLSLVVLIAKKKHIYMWKSCTCGLSPPNSMAVFSIIVCWAICLWQSTIKHNKAPK